MVVRSFVACISAIYNYSDLIADVTTCPQRGGITSYIIGKHMTTIDGVEITELELVHSSNQEDKKGMFNNS